MVDSSWPKLRRVYRALHQILSAENEDALETPFDSDGRDLRRDVQPRQRRLVSQEIDRLMNGVVRADQQIRAARLKFGG